MQRTIPFMRMIRVDESRETNEGRRLPGFGTSNGDNCLMGTGGLFLEDENVLELNRVVVTHHECAKCRQIIHFKIVTFYVMRISPQ